MIITITGKPCSGKGTVSKLFCSKYNFDYICTGDMFRQIAKSYGYDNILDFQKDERVKTVDHQIDNNTKQIGIERANEDIVIDSRLAWYFAPNSYKVFIDVSWNVAGERLFNAKRETEQVENIEQAKLKLIDRWNEENSRYQEIYNTNNLNPKNYDLIISSDNKSPEEIVDEIYKNYHLFVKKHKKTR